MPERRSPPFHPRGGPVEPSESSADAPGLEVTETSPSPAHPKGSPEQPEPPPPGTRQTRPSGANQLPERYEFRGILGRGGMGQVVEAWDRILNRAVAVKVLPSALREDPIVQARLLREAQAAAVLRHPGIVTVFDVDPERHFMVMEIVRGESLRDRIKRDGAQPVAEVRRIGEALLGALSAAHAAGVIHRDVKPANVLIEEASGAVRLADFGIASFGDSELTTPGSHVGTPAYMPPEQLRGHPVDERADVYATGATLFEAATGSKLHRVEGTVQDPDLAVRAATGDHALAAAIARAVSERPENRFPDAASFAEALRLRKGAGAPVALAGAPVALAPAPVAAAAPSRPTAPRRTLSSSRARAAGRLWILIVFLTAALAAAVWLAVIQAMRGGPDEGADGTETRTGPTATPVGAAGPPVVALLPFTDGTGDPRLDFARGGLPSLLGQELRRAPAISVLGYYRLLEHVSAPTVMTDWERSARTLGAHVLVRGVLTAVDKGVRVRIDVVRADGVLLGTIERETIVESVPEVVRLAAVSVASLAAGHPLELEPAPAPSFDEERSLQLAIAALEGHEFLRAREFLDLTLARTPELAIASYYLALVNWWSDRPPAETLAALSRALAGKDLDEAQRGFMEGLRLIVEADFPRAIDHFKRLAIRHPTERDILYGLAESLYHGGYPAEGIEAYRRACALSPSFRLGLFHALDYYAAHGDEAGIAWAIARGDGFGEAAAKSVWAGRALAGRGLFAEAIAHFDSLTEGGADPALVDLMYAYAASDQLERALTMVERIAATSRASAATHMLGIHIARGDAAALREWRAVTLGAIGLTREGRERSDYVSNLVLIELPAAPPAHLKTLGDAFEAALVPPMVGRLESEILRVLLHAALERTDVGAARKSHFPEVAAIATALVEERDGHPARAIESWRRAASSSADGRFLILERYHEARAARAAGNHEGVRTACAGVITPRVFRWSWSGAATKCLLWTGDAARALRRTDEAKAAYERLLAMRSAAGAGDAVVKAARAGLGALGR